MKTLNIANLLMGLAIIGWIFFASEQLIFKIWTFASLAWLLLITREREKGTKNSTFLHVLAFLHFVFTEFIALEMVMGGEKFFAGAIIFMFIGFFFAAMGEFDINRP